jgi:tRNA-dihydrouridine synthase
MLEHVPKWQGHSDWSHIARVKQPKNYDAYFGNGDIDSPEKALQY